MKNTKLMIAIAVFGLLLTACKPEGDTIINNYGPEGPKPPTRTMLKEYGLVDSSLVIRFSYQNNEIGKIKELISYDSGATTAKYVILYNSANRPEGYQSYAMPANTLQEQGTFKLDALGRIIEVIKRKVNGDTIGIGYYQYTESEYQPVSFSFFDQVKKDFARYEYFTYDERGNLTKAISYENNGTDPTFKSSEYDASGYGKAINPLNQLYNYLVAIGGDYGFSSSAALYFSNYLPSSTRDQRYDKNGKPTSVSVTNVNVTTDSDNRAIKLQTPGTSGTVIFFKY